MGTPFEELEKQARALSPKEKAALARILIDELARLKRFEA